MWNIAMHAMLSGLILLEGVTFAPAGEATSIAINDLEFEPATVTVHVGDMVTWRNRDIVEHTATSRDGAFDVTTPMGRPARWRAAKVGEFAYYCRRHPNMTGVIRVIR
jgi:plastocyanin